MTTSPFETTLREDLQRAAELTSPSLGVAPHELMARGGGSGWRPRPAVAAAAAAALLVTGVGFVELARYQPDVLTAAATLTDTTSLTPKAFPGATLPTDAPSRVDVTYDAQSHTATFRGIYAHRQVELGTVTGTTETGFGGFTRSSASGTDLLIGLLKTAAFEHGRPEIAPAAARPPATQGWSGQARLAGTDYVAYVQGLAANAPAVTGMQWRSTDLRARLKDGTLVGSEVTIGPDGQMATVLVDDSTSPLDHLTGPDATRPTPPPKR